MVVRMNEKKPQKAKCNDLQNIMRFVGNTMGGGTFSMGVHANCVTVDLPGV